MLKKIAILALALSGGLARASLVRFKLEKLPYELSLPEGWHDKEDFFNNVPLTLQGPSENGVYPVVFAFSAGKGILEEAKKQYLESRQENLDEVGAKVLSTSSYRALKSASQNEIWVAELTYDQDNTRFTERSYILTCANTRKVIYLQSLAPTANAAANASFDGIVGSVSCK